jgi:hypothetical protein
MKSGSEYWRRVEDLYHRAVECYGGERQALLDLECAGDDELRREVEALLAGEKRAQSFLESPGSLTRNGDAGMELRKGLVGQPSTESTVTDKSHR